MTTIEDLYATLEMQPGLGNDDAQTEISKEQFDNVPKHPFFGEPESSAFLTFFEEYDEWCDSEVAKGYPTQKEFADENQPKTFFELQHQPFLEKKRTPPILMYWHQLYEEAYYQHEEKNGIKTF